MFLAILKSMHSKLDADIHRVYSYDQILSYATLKIRGPTFFRAPGGRIHKFGACSTQILEHFRDFRSCSSGARRAIYSPNGFPLPSAPQPPGGLALVLECVAFIPVVTALQILIYEASFLRTIVADGRSEKINDRRFILFSSYC